MTPVEKFMLPRFLNSYGPPDAADKVAFASEYVRALGGVSADRIKAATDLLIDNHTYRNWPTVGECLGAVKVIRERIERMNELRAGNKTSDGPRVEPSVSEKARVHALAMKALEALDSTQPKIMFADLPRVDRDAWNGRERHATNEGAA